MTHRALRITAFIGAAVAALTISLGGQAAVSSMIHAYFDADGHLMFTYLDGTQVADTIPPGTYTVIYDNLGADDLAVDHAFHLSGPGVNFAPASTVVQSTFAVTFSAGSTYTVQDDLHPALERRSFVASSSGASAPTGGTGGAVATAPSSVTSTSKAVSNDIVGSDVRKAASLPLRGTLTGAVSSAGKLSLLYNGKTVGQIKAGRYTFVIDDQAPTKAFEVQRIKGDAVTVTGVKYVGKHKVTVPLDAGQWWFFTGSGKKTYFIVVR